MPAIKVEIAEKLRPYVFHKLADLQVNGESDATGTCPFCLRERKFFIAPSSGLYQCKTCTGPDGKSGGNVFTFIRHLHSISLATTEELQSVATERKLKVATLQRWGMVRSAIDGQWMLPGYSNGGDNPTKLMNLYRWTPMKQNDGTYKNRLLTTATLGHCLGGFQFWDSSKKKVYIMEGYFDGMAWEEALMGVKRVGTKLTYTNEPSQSLYSEANVVAVPGADVFKESWLPSFKGKDVILMYDSDHKRAVCKCKKSYSIIERDNCPRCGSKEVLRHNEGAGYSGMESAAKKLHGVASTISLVKWGEEGFDPSLKDGFDVGDCLTSA